MPSATDAVMSIARAQRRSMFDDRLTFFAHHNNRIWELVGGGPQGWRRRGDLVALNPQPLPPHESGRLLLQLMANGIIVVGGRDEGAREAFLSDLDDWCGTGWPRRWPIPPEPDPRERLTRDSLLGGAMAAADLAVSYPEGELQDFFAKAADRLVEAALS